MEALQPLVTVVLPTHDHHAFIAEAIESVLRQETTFPFDILLHDDASTDGTADICRAYAKRYPERITLIAQTVNQYQSDRRIQSHILFPRVKAKYTAILDGDDYWTDRSKLQRQVSYLEAHAECAMCISQTSIIGVDGQEKGELKPYDVDCDVDIRDMIRKGGGFCSSGTIVARTALLNRMPEFTMHTEVEDIPVQLWCASNGSVRYFAQSMAAYRVGVGGSWSTRQYRASKETRENTHRTVKKLLEDFDAYTEGRYAAAFREAIAYQEFQMLCLEHDLKHASKPPYRVFWQELSPKRRLRMRCEKRFPRMSEWLISRVFRRKDN